MTFQSQFTSHRCVIKVFYQNLRTKSHKKKPHKKLTDYNTQKDSQISVVDTLFMLSVYISQFTEFEGKVKKKHIDKRPFSKVMISEVVSPRDSHEKDKWSDSDQRSSSYSSCRNGYVTYSGAREGKAARRSFF